jgi:hypothetical protein
MKNLEETYFNSGENDGSRTISHSSLLERCRKPHWRDKSPQGKKPGDTRQLEENRSGNGKLNDQDPNLGRAIDRNRINGKIGGKFFRSPMGINFLCGCNRWV